MSHHITEKQRKEYYKALVAKDSNFEGVFFYAVTTTGTFCRPGCPSRKPKFINCRFFKTIKEASIAAYRPCLRCKPTQDPKMIPPHIKTILATIAKTPLKNWREEDFSKLGITSITLRRQFKKYVGLTFHKYVKKNQLELALNNIRDGKSIIDVQLSLGYESSSGFRSACHRIFGKAPSKLISQKVL